MSWNVWNRPSGGFMVDMGISSNIMKSPSPKCYMTFWDMTIYNDTLNCIDITPICEFITELDFNTDFDLITEFWRFPWNIATGAASQQRTLTPPDTWSCPIWDLHLFYGPFEFRTSLGTSILLWAFYLYCDVPWRHSKMGVLRNCSNNFKILQKYVHILYHIKLQWMFITMI